MGANITGGAAWGSWDHRMRGYLPGVGVKEMQLLPEMLSQHERRYNLKFPLSLVFHLCFPLADLPNSQLVVPCNTESKWEYSVNRSETKNMQ